jgi:hypothetical protein
MIQAPWLQALTVEFDSMSQKTLPGCPGNSDDSVIPLKNLYHPGFTLRVSIKLCEHTLQRKDYL